MRVLVTGGSGFVGGRLCKKLHTHEVISLGRKPPKSKVSQVVLTPIASNLSYRDVLSATDVVVHCAGMPSSGAFEELDEINVKSTLNLAVQAYESGVKRFIFISSIKVLGETTLPGSSFSPEDAPCPQDEYALSKYRAEECLISFAKKTGFDIVIIRPPMIYGKGMEGNLLKLARMAALPVPLPFAGVSNERSLVHVENLIDLIEVCIDHPKAKGMVLHVSDDNDLSLAALLKNIGEILGRKPRFFWVPIPVVKLFFLLLHKKGIYQRLFCSLRVNISNTKNNLNWHPPMTVRQGLIETFKKF
jgi:nucleoside-diphosphate-sugar epimerase